MPKVMQIRDVPDDVHAALAESARDNSSAIRRTQEKVHGPADRHTILPVLDAGRGE